MQGNNGQIADPVGAPQNNDQQEEIDQSIDELFEALQNYVEQQNAQENITVSRGDGFVFLSLNDAVFFNGDSYFLLDAGKTVLNDVGAMFAKATDAIDELRVLGHTAQARPDAPNDPWTDRTLASNRANVVLVYLQTEVPGFDLDPARMLSIGYGQHRPISSNETGELRAKNRRVEFIITGKNVEDIMEDSIMQYYTTSETAPPPGVFSDLELPTPAAPSSDTSVE